MVKKAKGGVYGPVDTETIKRWIQEGRITSEDELSEEGKYNWKKVSEFDEFSPNIIAPFGQASAACLIQGEFSFKI